MLSKIRISRSARKLFSKIFFDLDNLFSKIFTDTLSECQWGALGKRTALTQHLGLFRVFVVEMDKCLLDKFLFVGIRGFGARFPECA